MRYFFHKYSSKFILYALSFVIILSCVRKHKFDTDKKQLSDNKMMAVLTDIFLMEAYVNEKTAGLFPDSIANIKKSLYRPILLKHKIDSVDFYSTLNFYQAHPKEFLPVLSQVDSILVKIKPLDTATISVSNAPIIDVPKNFDSLANFSEQEKALREIYLKKNKLRKNENSK